MRRPDDKLNGVRFDDRDHHELPPFMPEDLKQCGRDLLMVVVAVGSAIFIALNLPL